MLQTPWNQRKASYDIVIIGSGYGGSITAARLANAKTGRNLSICILERGREWKPGDYPEEPLDVAAQVRSDLNPLGLYELLNYPDISVLKGSGLGGTSLLNANVAILPDREVFEQLHWPDGITYDSLLPFYNEAFGVLAANPHPRALELAKVKALDRRAKELGTSVEALNIVVNFTIDGKNKYGVDQKPCVNCGNCVTGCNVSAKNTLYMNYLPMAKNAGATILTQTKVEYLTKQNDGTWLIHGKHVEDNGDESFQLTAAQIILAAGALNSTEILLRSEFHGLKVSPALGTKFNGNGDFFGLAYNGDYETDTIGYPYRGGPGPGDSPEPGPNIVGIVRYNSDSDEMKRIAIEDFSFPYASVEASKRIFGALGGQPTVTGNEDAQRDRLLRDLGLAGTGPYNPDGALNHTMLYLVMGHDDARGLIVFEAPWTERDGRIRVSWEQAGQQQIFTRMNQELRRHAHALRANFIANPTWQFLNLGHLITAHPLGGCPMGDDHLQGAVDVYGRVFSNDGTVHQGLHVTDGSVIPCALGVNPFLTISAITEQFAARKIRELAGDAYPAPKPPVSMAGIHALDAIAYNEAHLEMIFRRCETKPIEKLVNHATEPQVDIPSQTVFNDCYWKGFFPQGHVLNAMSSAIFTGFRKKFSVNGNKYTGVTSDTDGRITANNSLEPVEIKHGDGGTLEPGKYILLKYLDFPWQGFYDIFKIINDDLMIGRVYLGDYPNGQRMFTFAMSRRYSFGSLTVADHEFLYGKGSVPTAADLDGVWLMNTISNANEAAGVAYLEFDNRPDGRLEASYQLMGLMEGLIVPSFLQDHFQLNDFTPFHDEIRKVTDDLMVGKYMTTLPAGLASLVGNSSLGLFHTEAGGKFGFYYLLSKTTQKAIPTSTLLRPFLDAQLPDGVGMTFTETMEGWYFAGQPTPAPGRDGDVTIGARIPASGTPAGAVACDFNVKMTIADVNEFVDGYQHEASLSGKIHFAALENFGDCTFTIDPSNSRFHYLRINPATHEAELGYHIEFASREGRHFVFDGVKYMTKDGRSGPDAIRELLQDYTTLYCHVAEKNADGSLRETGTAYLRFRTFEDLAAVGNFAGFLASFQITGTDNPVTQLQARLRFLAFTGQFVTREYDPLALPAVG